MVKVAIWKFEVFRINVMRASNSFLKLLEKEEKKNFFPLYTSFFGGIPGI